MTSLDRLLRPARIAVVGGHWAEAVVRQCRRMGYAGEIWPVNPAREALDGVPCYASIDALPAAPDAAFVGVNREASIEVVGALAARGAGGAICFAAGFSEAQAEDADAAGLQRRLLEAAGEMPFLGPNCYGLVNYLDGVPLWPDEHGGARVTRGVAIVSQSSNIAINMTMQRRGLPIAYAVTAGNQARCSLAQIATELLEDARVSALGLYIEGFGDLRAFERLAARARALDKPVVALRVGRSWQARATAASHTASLAGGHAAGGALLARLGIAQVDSIAVFLETLKLLHVAGPLRGRRLGSMSSSGGEAALIADAAVGREVEFPPLPGRTRHTLAGILGKRVSLANPLDYHTYIWGDRAAMRGTYSAMLDADFDLTMLVLDIPRDDRCDRAGFEPGVDCLVEASRLRDAAAGGAVAMVASLPENMPEDVAARLIEAGIVPLGGLEDALDAAAAAAFWREGEPSPAQLMLAGPPADGAGEAMLIDERDARRLLATAGVSFAPWRSADDAPSAATAAREVGFPVVLKRTGLAHKSDAGGVRLGLRDADAVLAAARSMPDGGGLLVEQDASGGIVELLVGIVRDPLGCFVLTLGAGGVHAELLRDRVSLLVPADESQIRRALRELRLAPVLEGYRGRAGVDMGALLGVVDALQAFVAAHAAALEEVEINPLILGERDAIAVDVLLRMRMH